ncbi:hypothetical protein A8709_32565 [Paenibacillus pectinilyticus]|uniref:Macroglobulin domain-containing protein n=1 Tax=Paenibacillus pectinilyticus TaxID=512399 RepID=A0A1C0ZWR1_9BACL|nr:hypothetical protein [Paenibacillus pectinilyticus]OCT12554.1 hypothetical protein A8709_32565 [Paenibacillus pectinilyticus]
MENLTSYISVEGVKNSYSAGDIVELIATDKRTNSTVHSVILSVPVLAVYEKFRKTSDGEFKLTLPVPYEAPPGDYDVDLIAIDPNGNRENIIHRTVSIF